MHFCQDEANAILAMFPFVGALLFRIKLWWRARFGHPCHPHENKCALPHPCEESSQSVESTGDEGVQQAP